MKIWKEVRNFWREKIILPPNKDEEFLKSGVEYQYEVLNLFEESFKSEIYFAPVQDTSKLDYYAHIPRKGYSFPAPTDININMMPFIAGENFKYCELPNYLENYWPLIRACLRPQCERDY